MSVTCAFLLHFWVPHSGVFNSDLWHFWVDQRSELCILLQLHCVPFIPDAQKVGIYLSHILLYFLSYIHCVPFIPDIPDILFGGMFQSFTYLSSFINECNKQGGLIYFFFWILLWYWSQNTNCSFIRGASFHQLFSAFPRLSFILCLCPNDRIFIHFYSLL